MQFFNLATYSPILSGGKQLLKTLSIVTALISSQSRMSTLSTNTPTVRERLTNFKTTELRADLTHLTDGDKRALVKLADVSDLLNSVYYQQIWAGASQLRAELKDKAARNQSAEATDELHLFELLKGPWDRSRENEPFIAGVGEKPKTANVYPQDMSAEEFNAWVKTLSTEEAKRAKGFYDVVVRNNEGTLELKRFSDVYQEYLVPASRLMKEAADLVSDKSFSKFLQMRGDAFLSNQYLDSEVAWLRISHESALEAAIGPYETYEDEMFSAKAFFESLVHVRDFEASEMLQKFTDSLQLVENNLPIPEQYKNKELVPPPIVVVNQVYSGGDTAAPLVAAFNLPNDEEAIELAGSKLTMIKNVQHAKFDSVLVPIARIILNAEDMQYVSFDAFFGHVLYHEVCHSAGPHKVLNTSDTVRIHLQDLHSTFEEAKADITGLFAAKLLIDRGTIDDISLKQFYTTYLASAFRSIRFGLAEAHGLGQAMQLSYLLEKGGFVYRDEKFSVNMDKMQTAVEDLTREIMLIQGDGDKERAVAFRNKYGKLDSNVSGALKRLGDVPVDIDPVWKDIEELRRMH